MVISNLKVVVKKIVKQNIVAMKVNAMLIQMANLTQWMNVKKDVKQNIVVLMDFAIMMNKVSILRNKNVKNHANLKNIVVTFLLDPVV